MSGEPEKTPAPAANFRGQSTSGQHGRTGHGPRSGWLKRAFLRGRRNPIIVLLFGGGLGLILGIIGYRQAQPEINGWDCVYKALQLLTLNIDQEKPALTADENKTTLTVDRVKNTYRVDHSTYAYKVDSQRTWNRWLEVARWWVAIFLVATTSWLFKVLGVFNEQWRLFRLGFSRPHVVVCGLGRKGLAFVKNYLADKRDVVAIELDTEADNIVVARELGALVLIGDASSEEILQKARAFEAQDVIAVTGRDAVNLQIGQMIKAGSKKPAYERQLLIHVRDPELAVLVEGNAGAAALAPAVSQAKSSATGLSPASGRASEGVVGANEPAAVAGVVSELGDRHD